MVNGRIDLKDAQRVKKNNIDGPADGYLLFYTTSTLAPSDPQSSDYAAIGAAQRPYFDNQAIYYAPYGTVDLSQEQHGLEGAAVGLRITINEESDDYLVNENGIPALTNAIFSTGNDSPGN